LLGEVRVAVRGGGDLGSGAAFRLHRAGFSVLVVESAMPTLVRRTVSFGSAVHTGQISVEGVSARRVSTVEEMNATLEGEMIPVIVDESCTGSLYEAFSPAILVDARLLKSDPGPRPGERPYLIGLGPGFCAPENCDALVETNRGHNLGRLIRHGAAEADTGEPGVLVGKTSSRVLRAPATGVVQENAPIGTPVRAGTLLATVDGHEVRAAFDGVLRGMVFPGTPVRAGDKIGDLDPRGDPSYCFSISDKSLAVGGGVLEGALASDLVQRKLRRETV
jgi:xanthine dehydrogenase accessory factor